MSSIMRWRNGDTVRGDASMALLPLRSEAACLVTQHTQIHHPDLTTAIGPKLKNYRARGLVLRGISDVSGPRKQGEEISEADCQRLGTPCRTKELIERLSVTESRWRYRSKSEVRGTNCGPRSEPWFHCPQGMPLLVPANFRPLHKGQRPATCVAGRPAHERITCLVAVASRSPCLRDADPHPRTACQSAGR